MKFAGSESLPRVEHFACGGFPSGMEHFHIRWIPFPAGVFCMRQLVFVNMIKCVIIMGDMM